MKKVKRKASNSSALSKAIQDLEIELKDMSKNRSELKKMLDTISSAINVDRQKEKELQEKIAHLLEREARLKEKKKNLEGDIDSIADKISKVSKIKSDMSNV